MSALTETSPVPLVLDFVAAARVFDARRLHRLLDHSVDLLGLDRTVDEMLLPAMRLVGSQWSRGLTDVAGEHLASAAATTWLGGVRALLPEPDRRDSVILCCGPRDLHTLGLDCLAVLLSARGVSVCNLGARTPTPSLVRVVREVRPAAVVLVAHSTAGTAAAAIRSLRSVAETGVDLYYAGAAFLRPQDRSGLPGCYLGLELAAAADLVAAPIS